jgi:hypothetical protein
VTAFNEEAAFLHQIETILKEGDSIAISLNNDTYCVQLGEWDIDWLPYVSIENPTLTEAVRLAYNERE